MLHYATERSDDEKKEIYSKWKSLINMSKKELVDWGEDPDHLEASLNREEAKDNGKIQSGYDSFHRIKRRKDKPFEDWTAQDFDNASQENGFNGRMLGGKPGKPVGSTGMSKWEISLRNWGHDPSKPNSPSYDKWKSWKKQNEEEIKMSLAKKKKTASRNVVSDLYHMSFKVRGGENLRKACYSYMQYTNQVKRAAEVGVGLEAINSLDQYAFSGEIIEGEVRITIETLNNSGPEIFKKVQNILNMSQQHGGEVLLRPEDISNVANSKLDPLDISKFNLKLDQMGVKEPLENKVQQVLLSKAPLLLTLSKAYPWILGLLIVVLISYLYTKNKKVIHKFIQTIFKRIRNMGSLLAKAIVNGYRWLMPIISNLVFVKSKEMWKEYSPTLKEYGNKGLDLAKEYGNKGLDLAKEYISKGYQGLEIAKEYMNSAVDKTIWLKDKQLYGENAANYLLKLRKDDNEQQEILNNLKGVLRSKRTARQNLIRTAFEIDYKLGNYLLKTI